MSYNIKYDNESDTINNWNDRRLPMLALVKKHNPAFIGMQEVLLNQLEFLDAPLNDHKYIGVGRDDGKEKGEFSPIFYDTKKYALLKSNTFWLSESPDIIAIGWDAALERICSYGLFQDKTTKKRLWVFNTHFDHKGKKARRNSVKLILKRIKRLNTENLPVILMGDLNLTPEEGPIVRLQKKMDDGRRISKSPPSGPVGTFNGFNSNVPMDRRIDYIFLKGIAVQEYHHIDERRTNGKHISDHLPVLATITY
ncbi:endonuclease/exonuclease/phosphatase family protein [Aggregatimonas sangjinii]|uniref:Endonuclease/exonuclease/phosphatase family protein n=2 Tax=Aggregatimonas sangjinii TaxID=2583587 RepID=A0A5B7SZV0_9FLAO|nr:endonuclease/exonuclease/phosphatase family protein [Aggregatimonas sangjinii]